MTISFLTFQLPMDNFYISCIENIVQSHDRHMTSAQPHSLNFDDMAPLLRLIQEKPLALKIAKWLVKQLPGVENRTKALSEALELAAECKQQAQTEVCKQGRQRAGRAVRPQDFIPLPISFLLFELKQRPWDLKPFTNNQFSHKVLYQQSVLS